jgi:hypothetical protein
MIERTCNRYHTRMNHNPSRMIQSEQNDHDQHPCSINDCALHNDTHDGEDAGYVDGGDVCPLSRLRPNFPDDERGSEGRLDEVEEGGEGDGRPASDEEAFKRDLDGEPDHCYVKRW